jgi:hypothetical protein
VNNVWQQLAELSETKLMSLKKTARTKILKGLYRGINKGKWFNMKPNTAIHLTFQKLFRINTC